MPIYTPHSDPLVEIARQLNEHARDKPKRQQRAKTLGVDPWLVAFVEIGSKVVKTFYPNIASICPNIASVELDAEFKNVPLDWLKETRRSHRGTFENRLDVDVPTVLQMPPVILNFGGDRYVVDGHHRINTMLKQWTDEDGPIKVIVTKIR